MHPIAMILAAGTGSRLLPLTEKKPKALLNFRGKTMLEHVIDHLKAHGFKRLVINVHHHAEQILQFLSDHDYFGLEISISDERDQLMDTGGGILKASGFLKGNGPFLVHNIDIFTDLDLNKLIQFHLRNNAIATLAVRNRETTRNLLLNGDGALCGWRNNVSGEEIICRSARQMIPLAFSGIHILNPEIFELIQQEGPFSIMQSYLELARNHEIQTFPHNEGVWIDMAHADNFPELE